jgi:hypothetical protein
MSRKHSSSYPAITIRNHRHKMAALADSSKIFCCSKEHLLTLGDYNSPQEVSLWWFSCCMASLAAIPIEALTGLPTPESSATKRKRPFPPPGLDNTSAISPPSSSQVPQPSTIPKIPAEILEAIVADLNYAIQVELWNNGEKVLVRYFIPHPGEGRENAFLEVERKSLQGETRFE